MPRIAGQEDAIGMEMVIDREKVVDKFPVLPVNSLPRAHYPSIVAEQQSQLEPFCC